MSIISHIPSPLASAVWLHTNLEAENLIILDATINKQIDEHSVRIPKARFFDIKKKFSDTEASFPSTLPSADQFQLEARKLGIQKNSAIIVYDDKGIYSSARCWWLFKVFGFTNIAVLNGGLLEWKNKGHRINTYDNFEFSEGDFVANFNPSLMTNFEGVNLFSKDNDVLIIDARSEARFTCQVDEPREGLRRGTIPNSLNLPYTELFNGNLMKPKSELQVFYNNLKLENNKVVFSCGSGITACILALGATVCEYKDLIVYDGSWTEYGTLTN